jgi:IS5 family transposase
MSKELTEIDNLLDDERFFAPLKERFYTRMGRPTVPVATYLRMMYLKRRYELGYETLVKEVKDSLTWRRFCRLSLEGKVPDSTTLIKLSHKYGEDTIRDLNEALVLKLKEKKVIRGRKLRIDTTVIEANIHYPTDTGLLADGAKVITRTVVKIRKLVTGVGKGFVNHTRKVKKTYLAINKVLKNRVKRNNPALVKAKEELVEVVDDVITTAKRVLDELDTMESKTPRIRGLAKQLDSWLEATDKVVEQTRKVLKGRVHLKLLIGDTDHGIITTYQVYEGNPADTKLLKPGVKGHRRLFRKRLKAVATDRGFYSKKNEEWLEGSSVKQASIPVRGKASKERRQKQKEPWFRRLQRFRAGSEGRISVLKSKFGLRRSLMRGGDGTGIWVGQGIFAHNLWQAARITG